MTSLEESPSTLPERRAAIAVIVGLATAIAALLLVGWLGVAVGGGKTLAVDDQLRATIHSFASPTLTTSMHLASRYGGPGYLVPLSVLFACGFMVRGWHRGALLVVVTLTGAALLNLTLKEFYGRIRPEPFFAYPLPDSPSFPSGHALFAMSIFGGLAALASVRVRHRAARVAIWVIALALIGLIGLSRVYLGVHYPTDVLAGYAVGLIWVIAVALGDRLAARRRRRTAVPN